MAIKEKSHIEIEIVRLLSQKDSRCLSLVYKNYSSSLFGIILNIVKLESVAEEVLQDVFLKFWQNSNLYDPEKSRLFTWLVNIARNASIDKVRSAAYKKIKKTDTVDNYVDFNSRLQIDASVEDSGLLKLIDGLDDKYKKLIYLVYYQGYSQREIVKEFDIPLGTVKTRLVAAIKALRSQLDDELIKKLLYIIPIGYVLTEIIRQSGY